MFYLRLQAPFHPVRLKCSFPPSICGLQQTFADLAARLPDGPSGDPHLIFHAGVLPPSGPAISTDCILFRKSHHYHNSYYRADALWMYLTSQKCRELGLLLLSAALHSPASEIALRVTRPDSAIRQIIIRGSDLRLDDPPVSLSMALSPSGTTLQ